MGSGMSIAATAKELGVCHQTVKRRLKEPENMGVGGNDKKQKGSTDAAEEGCEAGSEAAQHGEKESEQNNRKLFLCPTKPMKDFIVFPNQRSSEFGGLPTVGM